MVDMRIKYWGVRGSIPAPLTTEEIREKEIALIQKIIPKMMKDGKTTAFFDDCETNKKEILEYIKEQPLSLSGTYGGNTTCIEVQAKDSPLMVVDAGTGIRALGQSLAGKIFTGEQFNPLSVNEATKRDIHLFFTHYHWDHMQGFPFFVPGFISGNKKANIHFYGKKDATKQLSDVLAGQQQFPNFPIVWQDMPCGKDYTELGRMDSKVIQVGSTLIEYKELDHPDSVFGYAFNCNGKKFVVATDTEHRDSPDPGLVKLAKDADIMYYDAQYTPAEYSDSNMPRFRWGHSTCQWAIKTALAAGVKKVVLGHHEPTRNDFDLQALEDYSKKYLELLFDPAKIHPDTLKIEMAHEGLVHEI